MRTRIRLLVGLLASLLGAFALAGPTSAHVPCVETGMPGHSDFGRLHIGSHGPHGHGVGGHNPGTHRGFSLCNPNSSHFGEPK